MLMFYISSRQLTSNSAILEWQQSSKRVQFMLPWTPNTLVTLLLHSWLWNLDKPV